MVEALTSSERLLEEHAHELERSNAELEQFAFVASHDLSEPLRMVAGYVQLLRRRYRGKLDADADAVIEYAVDGADRMRRLIDDLLSYSQAGRSDEPFEPVDLQALAERAAERLRSPAPPGVAISVGPLPTLPGNAQGLGQLFQNLIGNAVKFVPAGRGAQVEIGAERVGAIWRFAVTDNGIGLEPGHAEQIFGMFERLHSGDDYPGTGIGLAIAKKVVSRHGGTIWAEPGAQGGSRFCFTLPAGLTPPAGALYPPGMADVAMPRLSDSMEEGTILKWLKSDGDEVGRGEELVEIETDKANMTYEADEAGVLKIVAQEGDTLAVGETIAQIGEGGGGGSRTSPPTRTSPPPRQPTSSPPRAAPRSRRTISSASSSPTRSPREEQEPDAEPQPEGDGNGRVKASPIARRMAKELGVELASARGQRTRRPDREVRRRGRGQERRARA